MSKNIYFGKTVLVQSRAQKEWWTMQAQTPRGSLSASWVSGGIDRGEIHIKHENILSGLEHELEKIVTTLKGRTKSLSQGCWVVVMNDGGKACETTATAFIEAITNLVTRAEKKAEKEAVRKRR